MPFAVGRDGAKIHYRETGEGATAVILIQGLGLSSCFWFDLPERLAAEARGADDGETYRVLVLDNRGVGKSDRPAGFYRMADMADDVAAVLDAAGVDKAYVVGISMGGMIAQHVALRHPSRVRGLVLLATTSGIPHLTFPRPDALAALLAMPFASLGGKKAGRKLLLKLLIPPSQFKNAKTLFAGWPDAMKTDVVPPKSFFAQLAAVLRHSTGSRLGVIDCPAVVVAGEHDILVPPKNSERIARKMKRASYRVMKETGHAVPLVNREVVSESLRELRRHVRPV